MTIALKRKRFIAAILVLMALVLVYSFTGEKGLIQLRELYDRRNELKDKVRGLETKNAELSDEINKLRNDPAVIEDLARTRLDMVKPGETVYVFPENAKEKISE